MEILNYNWITHITQSIGESPVFKMVVLCILGVIGKFSVQNGGIKGIIGKFSVQNGGIKGVIGKFSVQNGGIKVLKAMKVQRSKWWYIKVVGIEKFGTQNGDVY